MKLLQEVSLVSEIKVTSTERFVFRSFFRVAFCLIKHNWADTLYLVQLVSECGGKEIQMHLLTSPKNAISFTNTCDKVHQYYERIY